jgi:hypothetical protein
MIGNDHVRFGPGAAGKGPAPAGRHLASGLPEPRLRLNGLIARLEHTNTYLPTLEGQRAAVFYTKVHDRLLRPLLAANAPPAPIELRHALATIDRHVRGYIDEARLGNAA